MNIFQDLLKEWNLDMVIVVIVILSGFFQERFLGGWKIVKDARLCAALKTLIVSIGVSTIWIVITYREMKGQANGAEVLIPWGKYFISFFTATSIYDFIIRPIKKWYDKKYGDKDDSNDINKPTN